MFFWERFGNLEFFFFLKFLKNIYIHEQVHQMLHGFLEFKET